MAAVGHLGVLGSGTRRRDLEFRVWERARPIFALVPLLAGATEFPSVAAAARLLGGARRRPQLG